MERLEQADLAKVYRVTNLLALPSEGEGSPLVIQQAFASGLPGVMVDDPAVRAELPDGPDRAIGMRRPLVTYNAGTIPPDASPPDHLTAIHKSAS